MSTPPRLSVALTPCPNDTHVIGAVACGLLQPEGFTLDLSLHDIETLNRAALEGRYDITKISCARYDDVADEYAVLDTGAALVEGNGPLILARQPMSREAVLRSRVVAPGAGTTATLLFRLWAGAPVSPDFVPYHEIIPRLAAGEYDAGVIIHESRLTYRQQGLHAIVDLGDWWRATTGQPLPLGCYLIRRSLLARYGAAFDALLRRSMDRAEAGDARIEDYIRRHAQEPDPDVIRGHIALYVNRWTRGLGADGALAIAHLAHRCAALREPVV